MVWFDSDDNDQSGFIQAGSWSWLASRPFKLLKTLSFQIRRYKPPFPSQNIFSLTNTKSQLRSFIAFALWSPLRFLDFTSSFWDWKQASTHKSTAISLPLSLQFAGRCSRRKFHLGQRRFRLHISVLLSSPGSPYIF